MTRRVALALAMVLIAGACKPGTVVYARSIPQPGRPSAVAVTDDWVWVADDGRGEVRRYDAHDLDASPRRVEVEGAPTTMVADAGGVWVADSTGNSVVRIDADTASVTARIAVAATPVGLALVDGTLWVACIGEGVLESIDVETAEVVGDPIAVPEGAVRVAAVGDELVVSGVGDTVSFVDPGRRAVVGDPLRVGETPLGIAATGGTAFVAASDADAVVAVRGHEVVRRIARLHTPTSVVAVGKRLFVVDRLEQRVVEIDGRSVEPLFTTKGRPRDLTHGADALWTVTVEPSALVRLPVRLGS